MKRTCLGIALGFVLITTALPFVASAQSEAAPSQKTEKKTSAFPEELIINLAGLFDGQALFSFQKDTIEYRKSGNYPDPIGVTVNGRSWDDLSKPFQLDFTPDFKHASIVEKSGRGSIELNALPSQIVLRIEDKEESSAPYRVKIAAKNQVAREEGTTNGKKHPDIPVTLPVSPTGVSELVDKIVIKGYVDQVAGFRIYGARVFYQNYKAYPEEKTDKSPSCSGGDYASGVTVNGRKWNNLTTPLRMGVFPKISSCMQLEFDSKHSGVVYFIHDDMIEITIENKGETPDYFELTLHLADIGLERSGRRIPGQDR